jgi:chloramphenicol 3-O-phosphotransferase
MPVLSIVACRMLEDKLVYLLSADREVRELLLVDGMQALSLSAKLKAQNRPHLLLGLDSIARHLQERQSRPGGIFSRNSAGHKAAELAVVVSPLPLGLHSDLEQPI